MSADAIRLWHDCPTTINKRRAERFGAAICYLLLRQPEYGEKWEQVRSAFPSEAFWRPELPSWLRLDVLETLLTGKVQNRGYCVALMGPEQSLNKIVLRKVIFSFGRATSESVGWADLVRLVRIPCDDTTLSLLSLYIRQIFEFLSEEPRWASGMEDPRTQALASDEYIGDRVGFNIANALWAWETLAKVVTDPAKLSDMAEIYISFMRRIEDLASRIQADRALVQFMRRGLQKIVLSIGKRRIRDSVTYIRLVLGSISLAKALYLDEDSLEPLTEIGLWSSLEYVAWVARDNSGMSRKLRLEDFMIRALGWVAMNFKTQAKIQKLPNLVAFLASRLSSNDENQKARWLLVYSLGDKWRFADGHDASVLWIKTGLSAQLIDCLEQRADETRSSLLRLLTDLSKSSVWACRLVDDGFVKAMAGLINDLTPPQENCWTPLHDLATDALLSVWRSSAKTRLSYWAVDTMLVAIGRLLAFANVEQERRELGEVLLSVSIPFDDLLELVRSLAAHRGIHAFVARNVDVLINSIGTGFGKGPNWEYSGYCDSGSVELCSRFQLTGVGLL
ncbi:hypothetical protein FRC05_003340 [Tulasnella sp. 425]|nr:hypothetical protein FRC05_003340 [Tulasnella sp. 425]